MSMKTRVVQLGAAAALATVSALVIAGCGGSGGGGGATTTTAASDLATWAGGLCKAVTTYNASLAATRASLHAEGVSRPSLQVAVEHASAATRQLTGELDQLGPPPTPQADEAKKIIQDLQANLMKEGDKIRTVTNQASGKGSIKGAAETITGAITSAGSDASDAVGQLRALDPKETWSEAFQSAPPCASLG
jgi:hypothetical protein